MSFDPKDYDGVTRESEARDAERAEAQREDEAAELRAREYAFKETPACEDSGCFATPDFSHTLRCQDAVHVALASWFDAITRRAA